MDSDEPPNPRPGGGVEGVPFRPPSEEKPPGGRGFETRRAGSIFGNFKFYENLLLKNGHETDCVLMFGARLARIKFFFDWVRGFVMIRLLI